MAPGPLPIVAITGTNGKTTVTTLVQAMLEASGRRAVAAGNIGLPLLDAVGGDAEVVVAEVSSFQLALTTSFRPRVGAWLNFSADHLDWHATVDDYRHAKARLWANSGPGDVAVANVEDPVVAAASEAPRSRGATVSTFGLSRGDYTLRERALVGPDGIVVAHVDELVRRMPHDVVDALCALATAVAAGASPEGCRQALLAFGGLPHRVELVGEANGVQFYDDSKATTPGAVLAAVEGCATRGVDRRGPQQGSRPLGAERGGSPSAWCGGHRGGDRGGGGRLRGVGAGGAGPVDGRGRGGGGGHGGGRRRGGAVAGLRVVRLVRVLRGTGRRLRALCALAVGLHPCVDGASR